jgi:3-phenylpropionate/trans-cinnamate dioxygenase ferredoxin reductase component
MMINGSLSVDLLVVGAGHAAGVFARSARELGYSGSLMLVGQESHLPYERPTLSKEVLRDPAYAHTPILSAAQWEDLRVQFVLGKRVISVDEINRSVCLADGTTIMWERLVIATGARPRRLAGPIHVGRHVIRTIDDALAIHARLQECPDASIVIVGAGPIGLEAAASLRPFAQSVTVIEAADRVMSRVAPPNLCKKIARAHREKDVTLLLDVTVAEISDRGNQLDIVLSDGKSISADLLIEGIGVVPDIPLMKTPALNSDRGVFVDDHYRTAHPSVFAIGDVACPPTGRQETWAHAEASGRAAARSILGLAPEARPIPSFWSDQFSRIQVAGELTGAIEAGRQGEAYLFHKEGLVVAVAAMGASRDFSAARRLIGKSLHTTRQ